MLVGNHDAGQPVVGPRTAECLAALGVTHVSLLVDEAGFGVVIEGWAFDATRIDDAVRAVFPDASAGVRVFREVQRVAVVGRPAERS